MKEYTFILYSKDIDSTNKCLIKLWSAFLKDGKIGWHYRPRKNKNIIDVGDVSIHNVGSYNVLFLSKTKKIVTRVIFKKHNNKNFTKKEINYFNKINNKRFKINEKQYICAILLKIESMFGVKYLYPFSSKILSIYCIGDKQYIEFQINGFCKEQVSEKAVVISQEISDFLSTQTNSVVKVENITFLTKKTSLSKEIKNLSQQNTDWIDEYPINNSHFILPKYAKILLAKIILKDNNDLAIVLKAFHHFSHAIKLQQEYVQTELIISQLMSSIEVLTELENYDTRRCEKCGQSIYSIRKRVLSLIEDNFPKHMKKIFDNYYITRSKYLHSGILASSRQYIGICLPKISDKFKSGCEEYPIKININLIEWIGFLIRKKIENFVKNILSK